MMTETIKLPKGKEIKLISARSHPHPEINFLNGVRLGVTAPNIQQQFELSTPVIAKSLVSMVSELRIEFDAIVMVPSSRQDGKPFFDALLKAFPKNDLTPRFTRKNEAKAMSDGTTLRQVIDDYMYEKMKDEKAIKSLLIVDDCFARGLSVSAVMHHLLEAGLPSDCRVVVAVAGRFKGQPETTEE